MVDNNSPKASGITVPSTAMRARRPHLFSDTQTIVDQQLSPAFFEYYLDTITNRKQEYEFEHFCRKLAEKEICPNLRPQTGPTGGGDSKVDTETYPVAEEVSERWWAGDQSAGSERWGFAFSAKKKWKPKLLEDVRKIVATDRGYKRVYFVTNQAVSDKARATIEDELTKKHQCSVLVLDRTWLIDKVFTNGHLDLAISTLAIDGISSTRRRKIGPRDAERELALADLDKQIADPSRYVGARYQLVEDCLESALLARGLERPRNEVNARFAHATHLSKTTTPRQQMRVIYNHAWTTFWWYDDYSTFLRLYDEVEKLVDGSVLSTDTQRLVNLWQLLLTPAATGRVSAADARISARRSRIDSMLQLIAADTGRPTNAIEARTQQVIMDACEKMHHDRSTLDDCWSRLSDIVDESKQLPAFAIETLSNILEVIGSVADSASFDALYEKVVGIIRLRRSEGEAGEAYRKRGVQKLQQGKPYEAISWFGRAEGLLLKEEYSEELVLALVGSSLAYEEVGLLWAARQKILVAAERGTNEFIEDGTVGVSLARSLNRLVWIELRLGRISHALACIHVANALALHLKFEKETRSAYEEEVALQEAALAILILRLSLPQLSAAEQLPDALKRLGLLYARWALLFALGQQAVIEREFSPDNDQDLDALFSGVMCQPMAQELTAAPKLMVQQDGPLKSIIVGGELSVTAEPNAISFGIAESLLGGVEALLATSMPGKILPAREVTSISIAASQESASDSSMEIDKTSGRILIRHSSTLPLRTDSGGQFFRKWLSESILNIASTSFVVGDVESWVKDILQDEGAYSRAVLLADAITLNRNVFSASTSFLLSDLHTAGDVSYPLLRTRPWEPAGVPPRDTATKGPVKFGKGLPPEGMFDPEKLKHTDHHLLSPIDIDLWNRAGWKGVAFGIVDAKGLNALDAPPPLLGLGFTDEDAGKRIFQGWREKWGQRDENDSLRIAIIRGISARYPLHYFVTIGPNVENVRQVEGKTVLLVSRMQRMESRSHEALDRFLKEYARQGMYLLLPARVTESPKFFNDCFLAKRHLVIRDAWQIGENDPDMMVINPDDPPVIPPYVKNPPVAGALERQRNKKAQQTPSFRRKL